MREGWWIEWWSVGYGDWKGKLLSKTRCICMLESHYSQPISNLLNSTTTTLFILSPCEEHSQILLLNNLSDNICSILVRILFAIWYSLSSVITAASTVKVNEYMHHLFRTGGSINKLCFTIFWNQISLIQHLIHTPHSWGQIPKPFRVCQYRSLLTMTMSPRLGPSYWRTQP